MSVKFLTIRSYLLIALLPLMILSYQPVILLGMHNGFNNDISVLYLLTALTVILFLPYVMSYIFQSLRTTPGIFALCYLIFTWLSVVWSPNTSRAIVTACFLTMLFLLFVITANNKALLIKYSSTLRLLLLSSFLLVVGVALVQIAVDSFSLTIFNLPSMYKGNVFGVARPLGFSLEPQFLGSLLLIPFTWLTVQLFNLSTHKTKILWVICCTLLILTISRGALASAILSLIVLLPLYRPNIMKIYNVLILGALSVFIAIVIIFTAATIRRDNISGYASVSGVVNQLSLGKISLPAESNITSSERVSSVKTVETPSYVSDSTDSRKSMSLIGLNIWRSSLRTILFGVGIGGFGTVLHNIDSSAPISSIINNHYVEQLTELGLVGLSLFILFLISLITTTILRKQYVLTALVVAFIFQWFFFSGYANVIHVWIIFGLVMAYKIDHGNKLSSGTITK